jgi:hypothetical protein
MSPEQRRAARERLNWTRRQLFEATDVPLWFIAAFEDGKEMAAFLTGYELAMRDAFEESVSPLTDLRQLKSSSA